MEGADLDRDLRWKVVEEDEGSIEVEEEEEEFSFMFGGEEIAAAEDVFVNGQIKASFPFLAPPASDSDSPAVNKVFAEIEGPYCEWSDRKALEISQERCKKSNSTGSSKFRRFKEFISRSNSDGRDAFVYLNHHHASKKAKEKASYYSAHEAYLKSKANEEQRRRRYRPEVMGIFTNVNVGLTRNVHPF